MSWAKKIGKIQLAAVGFSLAIGLTSVPANAVTFSFFNVTNNNASDVATGIAQASLDVIDTFSTDLAGNRLIDFTFSNTGPNSSSITQIYFEDGALLGISQIFDDGCAPNCGGTDFKAGSGNLPGDNTFIESGMFDVEPTSQGGVQHNGINPGEQMTVRYSLLAGLGLSDVLGAMANTAGFGNPSSDPFSLRVGFHMQGFNSGGSEAFVNLPTPNSTLPPIPLPAAFPLFAGGLGLLGLLGWRRKRMATA